MDKNKSSFACDLKLDKDNYKRGRTFCKDCYNKKKKKNIKNTLIQNENTASHQQPKISRNTNRTLIIGFTTVAILTH